MNGPTAHHPTNRNMSRLASVVPRGKTLREAVPRATQGHWKPAKDRRAEAAAGPPFK